MSGARRQTGVKNTAALLPEQHERMPAEVEKLMNRGERRSVEEDAAKVPAELIV